MNQIFAKLLLKYFAVSSCKQQQQLEQIHQFVDLNPLGKMMKYGWFSKFVD